jgi:hypothetical protein
MQMADCTSSEEDESDFGMPLDIASLGPLPPLPVQEEQPETDFA